MKFTPPDAVHLHNDFWSPWGISACCVSHRKIHPTCSSRQEKMTHPLQRCSSLLSNWGGLSHWAKDTFLSPQVPPAWSLQFCYRVSPVCFSHELSIHIAEFCGWEDHRGAMLSVPKSQGVLALLCQLGTLHLCVCLCVVCTVEITVLPCSVGILQAEIYEYSLWD